MSEKKPEKKAGTTTITLTMDIPPGRADCDQCKGTGMVFVRGADQVSPDEAIAMMACPACFKWKEHIADILNRTLDKLERHGCAIAGRDTNRYPNTETMRDGRHGSRSDIVIAESIAKLEREREDDPT